MVYQEVPHIQGLHYPWAWAWGRSPLVPILRDGKTTVCDSTAILKYVDSVHDGAALYPASRQAEIEEWESLFDDVLGVETRRFMYFHALQQPKLMLEYIGWGVSATERRMAQFMFPMMSSFGKRRLVVTQANVESGEARVREILDRVELAMADHRPYLCGDQFTAADLSFACMLSPLLLPEQYGIPLPHPDTAPAGMQPLVYETRARPSGRFALRLFQDERPLPGRLQV